MPPTARPPAPPATTAPAPPAARVRRHDIDALRVLCTAAVVLCHTAAEFIDAGHRTAGIAADSLSRFAVPAFFAMAGWAALAGAPVGSDRRLLRRLERIARPMAVWTLLYLLWQYVIGPPPDDGAKEAVRALFGSVEPAFHLWYLYVYVPLVLLLGVAALVLRGRGVPRWSAALLAAFALAPVLRGDLGRLTGAHLPEWNWNAPLYALGYAVAGAALLAAPREGRAARRPLWTAAALAALLALGAYQFTVRHPAAYGSAAVAALTAAVLIAVRGLRVPVRLRAPPGAPLGRLLRHVPRPPGLRHRPGPPPRGPRTARDRRPRRPGRGRRRRDRALLRRQRPVGAARPARVARLNHRPDRGRTTGRIGP
ncbi:acyltransferase family protein [Streptomyces polyrhachis]|uniref:Acyltransferase family protein n=1 Tax=Streptomyces polyrhachis TaxID=1282885 RepID=A0ABW2GHS3_9ACTN